MRGKPGEERARGLVPEPMADERLRRPERADAESRQRNGMPGNVRDGLEDLLRDVLPPGRRAAP